MATRKLRKTKPRRTAKKTALLKKVTSGFLGEYLQLKKQIQQLQPQHWLILMNLGLAFSLVVIFHHLYSQTVLSFKVSPTVTGAAELRQAYPTKIAINSLKLDLAVVPAGIKDGIWQTSDKTATYLVTSARPSEGGNVVIYGHNQKHLFGPLHAAEVGDVVSVTTADGTNYEYKVTEIKVVEPSDIQEVLPTETEVLTIYTCTGFLDSKRLVLKAQPFKVSAL